MTAPWNIPTLLLTLLVEGVGLVLWNKIKRRAWANILLAFLMGNLLTQGLLFAGLRLSPFPYWPTLLGLELAVLVLEAAGYRAAGLPIKEAIGLSLALNLASFGTGLALPF